MPILVLLELSVQLIYHNIYSGYKCEFNSFFIINSLHALLASFSNFIAVIF